MNNDDYIEGTISISGKSATYQYKWYDIDGTVYNESALSLTMQQQ